MLEKKKPREQSGRDSFERYRAQVRSAAIASLSILEGKDIDRVYCDLHDDFVIRKNDESGISYVFYQVKTKGKKNYNWKINDIFGLNTRIKDPKKQKDDKIKDSFAGKLILHTVVFDEFCNSVIFQTNIHNSDDLDEVIKDIEDGIFENEYSQVLLDRFNAIFPDESGLDLNDEEIKSKLGKLQFENDVQYLKIGDDNFEPIARDKIYRYSEVDLSYTEAREILLRLLDLVEKKSSGVISDWTYQSIEEFAGVSIEDLLSVLSISKDAYHNIAAGGDPKAVKSASIIQRSLSAAGVGDDQIAYCSRCKSDWDIWVSKNRHVIPEFSINIIISSVAKLLNEVKEKDNTIDLSILNDPILSTLKSLEKSKLKFDLNEELILGGVFSELVKSKS